MINTSPSLLFLLIVLSASLIVFSKKQNFSKRKTAVILAAFYLIFVIVPLLWLNVIQPKWEERIRAEISSANYCSIDSDCAIEYFNGVTCGSYVNKNEVAQRYSNIHIYYLLTPDGCMGGALSQPKCENKKCVGIRAD